MSKTSDDSLLASGEGLCFRVFIVKRLIICFGKKSHSHYITLIKNANKKNQRTDNLTPSCEYTNHLWCTSLWQHVLVASFCGEPTNVF